MEHTVAFGASRALSAAAEAEAGSHHESSTTTTEALDAVEALCVFLVLICLTVLFEKTKHNAEHAAGRSLEPIVRALFGELTVLGFLSTITYCLEQFGVFEAISDMISGEKEEHEGEEESGDVFEAVETIHFGMFFVMVIFLASILYEVSNGLKSQMEWSLWDRACHDDNYIKGLLLEKAKLDREYDDTTSSERTWKFLLPYLSFIPSLRDRKTEELEDKMDFCSLREEFFKERGFEPPFTPAGEEGGHKKALGEHFNFGRYLTHAYAKKMAHIVEIDATTWIIVAVGAVCYFLLLCSFGFSLKALAWAWVAIGWVFHILSVQFEMYLLGIRNRFLAPKFVPSAKLRKVYSRCSLHDDIDLSGTLHDDIDLSGTEREPLNQEKDEYQTNGTKPLDGLPLWCHIDLDTYDKRRGPIDKFIFGATPTNRQHAPYMFGKDGPVFHLLCLRIMLMFSCIYTAQLVILFVPMLHKDENTSTLAFIAYCGVAFIPAFAFIFNKGRLITSLVQAGCIGPFLLPQAVSESEREEKTSMTVRVLVVCYKLARMTKKFLENPSSFEFDCGRPYTEILGSEEIAGFSRMFTSYFDSKIDGFWSSTEIWALLNNVVGVSISKEDTYVMVRVMMKSIGGCAQDGAVGLSTDAFIQWYTSQFSTDDRKECADFLFRRFDDDNSGDITALEFEQALEEMNIGITTEEAEELLQELDHNGDGVLNEEEFEVLLENFYPIELVSYARALGGK